MTKTAPNLTELNPLCADLAAAHAELETLVTELKQELSEVTSKFHARIRKAAAVTAGAEFKVRQWVDAHREQFEKPRRQTLHGIVVGLQESKGSVEFDDEATLIATIRKMYRDDAEGFAALVATEEKVRKPALRALPVDVFRKLGCRIEGDGDQVLVTLSTGDVEKLMTSAKNALVAAMIEGAHPAAKQHAKN